LDIIEAARMLSFSDGSKLALVVLPTKSGARFFEKMVLIA
jgi:hypothetical protein